MLQPAQGSPPRLPQASRLFDRRLQPPHVGFEQRSLPLEQASERLPPAGQPDAPDRPDDALDQDHGHTQHQEPGTDRAQGHSLPSPSSMTPTGAIATTPGSSVTSRITMTP